MTQPIAGSIGASAALAALAAEAWDSQMAAHPVYATALGDRRFDDRLRANGPDALAADAARLDGFLGRVAAIDPGALAGEDRVNRLALVDFLRSELDLVEAGLDAWMVDPLDGPQVAYLNVASFQPVRTVAEGEALVARWREIGPWVDRLTGTTRESQRRGVAAPQALIRNVIAELDDLLAGPVEEWPLVDPARDEHPHWTAGQRTAHADAVRAAVVEGISPAFARYRMFLADELAPAARDDEAPGLSHLPGAAEAYARLVRAHTTLDPPPEE